MAHALTERGRESAGRWAARALSALLALAAWLLPAPAPAATGAPPPAAELILERDASGTVTARGSLPKGLAAHRLTGLLPGLRGGSDLATGHAGDPGRWLSAIDALHVVLPRIGMVRIVMRPGTIDMHGRLRPGFSLKEVRPALRAALGEGWRLRLGLSEVPPPARLDFAHDVRGTRLSGILPSGLSIAQALITVPGAEDAGLATGAEGRAGRWARVLSGLGGLLRGFARAEGRISAEEGLAVSGRLAPGQSAVRLEAWAEGWLPESWDFALSATETPAAEGATRHDPATRRTEMLVGGRWLAQFDFPAGRDRCNREAAEIQRARKLTFAPGEAALDAGAERVIDRLAGLALHCLEGTELLLEIGGHTDSVGDAEANRALSRARARSVRRAFARRGVPDRRMRARGHGDQHPVADNDTEDGRARNRRITLDWRWPAATDGIEQALDQ